METTLNCDVNFDFVVRFSQCQSYVASCEDGTSLLEKYFLDVLRKEYENLRILCCNVLSGDSLRQQVCQCRRGGYCPP